MNLSLKRSKDKKPLPGNIKDMNLIRGSEREDAWKIIYGIYFE